MENVVFVFLLLSMLIQTLYIFKLRDKLNLVEERDILPDNTVTMGLMTPTITFKFRNEFTFRTVGDRMEFIDTTNGKRLGYFFKD